MKLTFVKTASKKFITAAAIIAALSIGAISNAHADEIKENNSAVEYVGAVNENAAFNVKYINASGSDFNLTIKNEIGDVIYSHKYSGKDFRKEILINQIPEDGALVTFIIKGADANFQQSFKINTSAKVTAEVTVTKTK